jgi:hypothetical protein
MCTSDFDHTDPSANRIAALMCTRKRKKNEPPCLNFAQEMLQKGDLKSWRWRGRDDERERENSTTHKRRRRCLASQAASILLARFLPKSEFFKKLNRKRSGVEGFQSPGARKQKKS